MTFPVVLSYALPPLLGAVIGYVTNAIAIKMLFRPHRQWRFLGIRVPFTPGIIPRRRGQLAESIGRMVSDELLTAETIKTHTSDPEFVAGIERQVGGVIARTMERRIETFLGGSGVSSPVATGIRRHLASLAESRKFEALVAGLIEHGLEGLSEKRFGDLFGDAGADLPELLASRLTRWLAEPERRSEIAGKAASWVDEAIRRNRPVGAILDHEAIELLGEAVDRVYPSMCAALSAWLREQEMRELIARRGRVFVRNTLDRLTTVQRFFVAAAQYDRQLEAKMPAIVQDAIDSLDALLAEPTTRLQVKNLVTHRLSEVRDRGFGDLAASLAPETGDSVSAWIQKRIDGLLAGADSQSLYGLLDLLLGPLHDRKIGELVETFTTKRRLSRRLASAVCRAVARAAEPSSEATRSPLSERIGEIPLGALLGIDEETSARIGTWAVKRGLKLLHERIPQLLDSLDVRTLVVNRINGLDVAQVEGLLMRVIQRHLKWINVFGAMLGFLIGTLQIVMRIAGWG